MQASTPVAQVLIVVQAQSSLQHAMKASISVAQFLIGVRATHSVSFAASSKRSWRQPEYVKYWLIEM